VTEEARAYVAHTTRDEGSVPAACHGRSDHVTTFEARAGEVRTRVSVFADGRVHVTVSDGGRGAVTADYTPPASWGRRPPPGSRLPWPAGSPPTNPGNLLTNRRQRR
jgi:hypothetical protein